MTDTIINDEVSKKELKDNVITIIKGSCNLKIKYKTKEEAQVNYNDFHEFDIMIRPITDEVHSEIINDIKIKDKDTFYSKYLFNKEDIYAIGDVNNVDDSFIKSIVPFIKYIDGHDCYSLADKKLKARRGEYSHEYKRFNDLSRPFGINNIGTMGLAYHTTPMSSWKDLLQVSKCGTNALIYFKYKLNKI